MLLRLILNIWERKIPTEKITPTVIVLIVLIFAIALLVTAVPYILNSRAVYILAKRRGLKHPGLSWIMVTRLWLIGKMADDYNERARLKPMNFSKLLTAGYVLIIVFGIFDVITTIYPTGLTSVKSIGSIVIIGLGVLRYIALYKLYCSCITKNRGILLTLSILFGQMAEAIILTCICKKDDGMKTLYGNEPFGEN